MIVDIKLCFDILFINVVEREEETRFTDYIRYENKETE